MSKPRLVPWCSWDEWGEAKECFFDACSSAGSISSKAEQLQRGIALVDMWRLRGQVPHACDSTAQLAEVSLTDSSARLSQNELRLIYSMIITRAVNGLVDGSQQSYFADSVLSLASRIGLPSWLVELRHESTHQQLPSLTVLRMGCECLLLWYRDNYWNRQIAHLHELSSFCVPHAETGTPGGLFVDKLISHKTYFADVFVPLFYEANVNQSTQCGAYTKRKGKKWLAKQYDTWGAALAMLRRVGAYYIAALILHLAVSVTELVTDSSVPRSALSGGCAQASCAVASSSNSEGESGDGGDEEEAAMAWRVSSATFWLEKLLALLGNDESGGGNDSSASLRLLAGMTQTLLGRVEGLSRPSRQVLAPACAVLAAAVVACGGGSSDSGSGGKRQREADGGGVFRMVAGAHWPLGAPAGCFGSGRLTEIEDVQGSGYR